MEDEEQLGHVQHQTLDEDPLFALQAWAPNDKIQDLRIYAGNKHLAMVVDEPKKDETPPTLLKNPAKVASGQDLLSFYVYKVSLIYELLST